MKKAKGHSISEFPHKKLKKVADLIFYEGPILSHYKDDDSNNLLFYWIDYDSTYNRWLVVKTNEFLIYLYLKKVLSLNGLLKESSTDFVLTVDIDKELTFHNTHLLKLKELDPEYLPEEKLMYASEPPKIYDSLIQDNEGTGYIQTLRENALYLKLKPTTKKYESALSTDEIINFFKEFNASFSSFLEFNFLTKHRNQFVTGESIKRAIDKIKKEVKPRIVELEYKSFGFGVSLDTFHDNNETITSDWKKSVIKEFKEDVFEIDYTDEKELKKIAKKYPDKLTRNKIYEPIIRAFSEYEISLTDNHLNKIIQTFKPVKPKFENILITHIEREEPKVESSIQVAKVAVTTGPKKVTIKTLELFDQNQHSIGYNVSKISYKDNHYQLRYPLYCKIEKSDEGVLLEYEPLAIVGFGKDMAEAEQMFCEEFDYIYTRYNELSDDKLTEDVKGIKSTINYLVIQST